MATVPLKIRCCYGSRPERSNRPGRFSFANMWRGMVVYLSGVERDLNKNSRSCQTHWKYDFSARSSTGQSNGLRNHRLGVRVPPGVVLLIAYHAVAIARKPC